jgi:hypothetical protein
MTEFFGDAMEIVDESGFVVDPGGIQGILPRSEDTGDVVD